MRHLLPPLAACLSVPAPAAPRPMTPEDLWKVKRVGAPSVSPDGTWCVVDVTTWDLEKDDSTAQLWLLSTDGNTQKQLTNTAGKNPGPKWSPDGKSIAFVSRRAGDDGPQVPVTQGLAYYNTLRQKGEPARLAYFPDENHWVLKPQNSLVWHREVFGWLDRYVGHGPTK